MLSACEGAPPPDAVAVGTNVSGVAGGSADALDRAAIRAGVLADVRASSPVGLYQNRHEAGRDALCLVRDGEGRLRFGMEAVFGENTRCSGRGTARQVADKLIFNFSRSSCLVVARYEGDKVSLPGALDVTCRDLCSNRGSFEGVSFPRTADDEASALAASNHEDAPLCE